MVMADLIVGRALELDKDNAQRGTSTGQGMVCTDARTDGSGSTALSVGDFAVFDSLDDAHEFYSQVVNRAGALPLAGVAPVAAGSQGHQLSLKHVKRSALHHITSGWRDFTLVQDCRSRGLSDAPRNVVGLRLD